MRKFKKIVASLMALGMVSTMGISAFADTVEDTQKTFYTGDVNLDGNVNIIDLLYLKKMILGITSMSKMYIDGDTLKMVEETQGEEVTINATEYTINVEDSTIHVTGIGDTTQMHDLTLKVTDDTVFSDEDITSLEDLAQYTNIVFLDITYDANTMEIIKIENIIMPPTTDTYNTINTTQSTFMMGSSEQKYMGYVVDLEENLIKIQVDTVPSINEPVYLLLIVTDDTIFNAEAKTLEELSNLGTDYCDYVFTFDMNTQELSSIEQIDISYQQPPIQTLSSSSVSFYFNPNADTKVVDVIKDDDYNNPFTIEIPDGTVITVDGVETTLNSLVDAQKYSDISISFQYDTTSQKYIATDIIATTQDKYKDTQELKVVYGGSEEIFGMNTEMGTISIANDYNNQVDLYYTNDNTTYTGLVSSFDELGGYQSCYLSVMTTDLECYTFTYEWIITYYTNALGYNIVTSIDVSKVQDIQTMTVGIDTDYDIIEAKADINELHIMDTTINETKVFKVTNETTYTGGISSLSDVKYPDWHLTISYYVNDDDENIVTNIDGFPVTMGY